MSNVYEHLKARLQPLGTSGTVRLAFNDSPFGVAFYKAEFVHAAVDELARRAAAVHAGVDQFTPLERLAAHLLTASAYVDKAELQSVLAAANPEQTP